MVRRISYWRIDIFSHQRFNSTIIISCKFLIFNLKYLHNISIKKVFHLCDLIREIFTFRIRISHTHNSNIILLIVSLILLLVIPRTCVILDPCWQCDKLWIQISWNGSHLWEKKYLCYVTSVLIRSRLISSFARRIAKHPVDVCICGTRSTARWKTTARSPRTVKRVYAHRRTCMNG